MDRSVLTLLSVSFNEALFSPDLLCAKNTFDMHQTQVVISELNVFFTTVDQVVARTTSDGPLHIGRLTPCPTGARQTVMGKNAGLRIEIAYSRNSNSAFPAAGLLSEVDFFHAASSLDLHISDRFARTNASANGGGTALPQRAICLSFA